MTKPREARKWLKAARPETVAKRNILIREFNVQVYADGRLELDGLDSFVCWLLRRKGKEGLLPFAVRISKFGRQARPAKKNQ